MVLHALPRTSVLIPLVGQAPRMIVAAYIVICHWAAELEGRRMHTRTRLISTLIGDLTLFASHPRYRWVDSVGPWGPVSSRASSSL